METEVLIENEWYEIPAVLNLPKAGDGRFPAVILCHGTASQKNEVGDMFIALAAKLETRGIASIRFDFAGCGDSEADQRDLTFYGEVSDTQKIYQYLQKHQSIDSDSIGILGFSQGARVMAEFLGRCTGHINAAVSLSGACHNGKGVFSGWFEQYYAELEANGYAEIPMSWREDLILSKTWFDEIKESQPMKQLETYTGHLLAIAGTDDELVPYHHGHEIIQACKEAKVRDLKIIKDADHIFNCLDSEGSQAAYVLECTSNWINQHI